ncbi:MAG TPA: sugar ABC transporter substrate-binding protein [Candidatus Baltobacterales bacterium]|nr:sugar ABC transporter substrate-binding protein [Candidatus Baltobacterales bacterium]
MQARFVRLTLAIVLFAAVALTACGAGNGGGAGSSTTTTIGVSFDILHEIRKAELKGIDDYAAEKHVKILFSVANTDASLQAQQIQNFISQHVNGIIAIAQNNDQIVASIRAANAAGIPFAAIDRAPSPGGQLVAQVTGNPVADGGLVAAYMGSLPKQLNVLLMVGALTDVNAIGRRDGFKQSAAAYPNLKIVQELPTNWDPTTALNGVTNALQAHPEINAIFDPSDYLLPSVVSALKSTGRFYPVGDPKHVTVVTIDGDNNGCGALKNKWIDADVATLVGNFGPSAIDAILAANQSTTPTTEKVVQINGLTLSQQNFAATQAQVWGCAIPPDAFK